MTTAINSDVSTQDWVRKLHFENKVDLNLQAIADSESTKIQVDDIPITNYSSATTTKNSSDSYLLSILSSPSQTAVTHSSTSCTGTRACDCYKCQRQRRRSVVSRTATTRAVTKSSKSSPDVYTPLKKIENVNHLSNRPTETTSSSSFPTTATAAAAAAAAATKLSVAAPVAAAVQLESHMSAKKPPPPSSSEPPQIKPVQKTQTPKRTGTQRKTPTLKSYEKHMPRPAYAQKDSIYRIEQEELEEQQTKEDEFNQSASATHELLEKEAAQDNYQISWKDEGTGDDLLTCLVTFQTIFEEKAGNENEGLSDLLEQRTKELKSQKLLQNQHPIQQDEQLPERLADCLTLSHRNGPRHNPLTLYHTMKMNGGSERMKAYHDAFQHCIHANSGMRAWIKKPRVAPTRENSRLVQPATGARRPTIKRSLLRPLASRKNKAPGDELLIYSASPENLSIRSAISLEMISSPIPLGQPQPQPQQQSDQMIDIISTTQTFLPNRQFSTNTTTQGNKTPYEHIDTPSRPRPTNTTVTTSPISEFKDNSSISSVESANGVSRSLSKAKKGRHGRLFSSIGRKSSMRSHHIHSNNKTSSIRSLEKIDSGNESTLTQEIVVLDDLCRILPHIERSHLLSYVQEAHCDYAKALQLCKSAVIAGKLS